MDPCQNLNSKLRDIKKIINNLKSKNFENQYNNQIEQYQIFYNLTRREYVSCINKRDNILIFPKNQSKIEII